MSGNAAQLCREHGGIQVPTQVWSKASQTVHGGLSSGTLLQLRSNWSEKGLSTPGRPWPVPSLSLGPSIQAVTKEASAWGDLKPLQIPHLRDLKKTHCWAELHVLLQSTQDPCNEEKAGDAHKVQHLLDLPPGLAIDVGESLHPSCLHLPLAVVICCICSQIDIFCACVSLILGSIYRF